MLFNSSGHNKHLPNRQDLTILVELDGVENSWLTVGKQHILRTALHARSI